MCLSYKYVNAPLHNWGSAGASAALKLPWSLACCNRSWILWLWNYFALELSSCSVCGGVRSGFIYVTWNNDKPVLDMACTWLISLWKD